MSAEKIVLSLPFAPSINRLWRVGKGKKIYKSRVYEDWIAECQVVIFQAKAIPVLGKYKLTIEAVRPDKRRRDVDNLIKAVSDVLESTGLIENDCLCEEVIARWVEHGPPMLVTVEKVNEL